MPVLRFEASLGFFAWLTDDERRLAQLPEAILSVVISCQASSHVTAWGNSLGSRFLSSVVFPPRAVFSRSNASIFYPSSISVTFFLLTSSQSSRRTRRIASGCYVRRRSAGNDYRENCLMQLRETTLIVCWLREKPQWRLEPKHHRFIWLSSIYVLNFRLI